MKHTEAMLDQRAKSWTWGVGLKYTVDGKAPAPATDKAVRLKALETELAALRARIPAQEAEALRYSGGLVGAMSLMTLATARQSEAMLEQQLLLTKYDIPGMALPMPEGLASAAAARPGATPVRPSAALTPPVPAMKSFEIVSIDAKITESNNVWSRFAWRLKVRNLSDEPIDLSATIEFQDAEGFIVDTDREYGLVLAPKSEDTFTGQKLITARSVSRVTQTAAKLSAR